MHVRELMQPSSTCDVRGHICPITPQPARNGPSTSIDADLCDAAAGMRTSHTSTLQVLDCEDVTGEISLEDLLRGALESGDQQLCSDLSAQMREPIQPVQAF